MHNETQIKIGHHYKWDKTSQPYFNAHKDASLIVKHLKPTGANYNKTARYKQGEAFYTLGYGFLITAIASAKLAMMKKKPLLFLDYIKGFWKAKWDKKPLLVSEEQATFIRQYRWKKMKDKIVKLPKARAIFLRVGRNLEKRLGLINPTKSATGERRNITRNILLI